MMSIKFVLIFSLIGLIFAEELTVGVVVPYTEFQSRIRTYGNEIKRTWTNVKDSLFGENANIDIRFELAKWPQAPTPDTILTTLCQNFLPKNVTLIIYITNIKLNEFLSPHYFLRVCNSIGLPVIALNSPSSGLEALKSSVILQLAPSLAVQVQPMLALLIRYEWTQFCCISTTSRSTENLLMALRADIADLKEQQPNLKLEIMASSTLSISDFDDVNVKKQLNMLISHAPNCRIYLLHASNIEARAIFKAAKQLQLTTKDYLWIVTQSVIVSEVHTPEFPPGLLGINFENEQDVNAGKEAVNILGHALHKAGNFKQFQSNFNCSDEQNSTKWEEGLLLYKYLKNVSIVSDSEYADNIEFNVDGTLKQRPLIIVNLNSDRKWQHVGTYRRNTLTINDIVWPGGSHIPPLGKPEKFHLRISFLEEPPYLTMSPSDSDMTCRASAAPCIVRGNNGNVSDKTHCCSGFCIDLLNKLSKDMDFSFDLIRVADGRWGGETNGKWNGLVAELIEGTADMVMTSLKINLERESAVDFSVPFMETGISIIVAKRTGIISPHAITQPFDMITWFAILIAAMQTAVFAIFLFEWLSPDGFNRQSALPHGHELTLFQTYWMAWALLFQAAVNVEYPRGCSARFMGNCWALFAVIFVAIYTANLAVFMITKELHYDFSGLNDSRLQYPLRNLPSMKYSTIPSGNTETVIKSNYPYMYSYMRKFNRSTVIDGVNAVKSGELDAFVYDATVLDYLAGQDDDCRLLTVGKWYAMTGYSVAFQKNSKYTDMFSQQILNYKESGQLEQWQRFWFTGACRPKSEVASEGKFQALSFEQFISAFVLLALGMLLSFILFMGEHCFHRYASNRRPKSSSHQCWTLVSRNVSRSLNATSTSKISLDSRCENLLCEVTLEQLRVNLKEAKLKAYQMEKKLLEVESQFIQGTFL